MSTSFVGENPSNALKLPGRDCSLDSLPNTTSYDLFPNALSKNSGSKEQKTLTLRELSMLQLMNHITDKVDWQRKIHQEEIATKWQSEACSTDDLDMSQRMASYCIDELRYKASLYTAGASSGAPQSIIVFPGDVVKSDIAVSSQMKLLLQRAVKTFEGAIPESARDWHPGSNGKVWDLVHPSLFPLVYGRSRVLSGENTTSLSDCIERCGEGVVLPILPKKEAKYWFDFCGLSAYSNKFQWLPCEVDISGENARFTSYINNLHPKRERALYGLVEKLIDASIPLWNRTLAPLADRQYRQPERIKYTRVEYDPDPARAPETEGRQQREAEDENDYWDRRQEWIEETRKIIYPEPDAPFVPHAEPAKFDLRERYSKSGLQIIVKLANIQLTPENPCYDGGSWHVEGQMNERIIATSLYYYSSDNITTSTLSFRQQIDSQGLELDVSYPQNDHEWLWDIFGCDQDGYAIQDLGCVETREGRLLTFPNTLQHRVVKFQLEDLTKPGHRKVLALFLVDPNIKTISTAHVPCQQQEWWWEAAMEGQNRSERGHGPAVGKVPNELQDHILKNVDFPMTMEDAKNLRLELMEERKVYSKLAESTFEGHDTFSLCEH
ncbi:hypothetical protein CPB83DRAFT_895559 [Crepidotus variabilis]|uniref:Uncharacterized protein n=1 Tax=Crepidotus variabilis TaxID=179855 RepID=A0A9P6JN88_9AGAR|nr:hypothetical protein CPB83DRAFT_895559 [Crepidotus variabilis]